MILLFQLSFSPTTSPWSHAKVIGLLNVLVLCCNGLFFICLFIGWPDGIHTFTFMLAEVKWFYVINSSKTVRVRLYMYFFFLFLHSNSNCWNWKERNLFRQVRLEYMQTCANVKPFANRHNIVSQQLPTLLAVTCCISLHTLARPCSKKNIIEGIPVLWTCKIQGAQCMLHNFKESKIFWPLRS